MTFDPRLDGPPATIRGAHYDPATRMFFDDDGRQVLNAVISTDDTYVDWFAPVVVPHPDDYAHADLAPEPPSTLGWLAVALCMLLGGTIMLGAIWALINVAILAAGGVR